MKRNASLVKKEASRTRDALLSRLQAVFALRPMPLDEFSSDPRLLDGSLSYDPISDPVGPKLRGSPNCVELLFPVSRTVSAGRGASSSPSRSLAKLEPIATANSDPRATKAAIDSKLISDQSSMAKLHVAVPWPGTGIPSTHPAFRLYCEAIGLDGKRRAGVPLRWHSVAAGHPSVAMRMDAFGRGSIDDPISGSLLLRCNGVGDGEEFAPAVDGDAKRTAATLAAKWVKGSIRKDEISSGHIIRSFLLSPEVVCEHDCSTAQSTVFAFYWDQRTSSPPIPEEERKSATRPRRDQGQIEAMLRQQLHGCGKLSHGPLIGQLHQAVVSRDEAVRVWAKAYMQTIARTWLRVTDSPAKADVSFSLPSGRST